MEALFEIVKNQMEKHKVEQFHAETVLLEIAESQSTTISAKNDFHFFANAFTSGTTADGTIRGTAGGNALSIIPLILSTKLHKYQMFKGEVRITNHSSTNKLFVEFLRITPIPQPIITEDE